MDLFDEKKDIVFNYLLTNGDIDLKQEGFNSYSLWWAKIVNPFDNIDSISKGKFTGFEENGGFFSDESIKMTYVDVFSMCGYLGQFGDEEEQQPFCHTKFYFPEGFILLSGNSIPRDYTLYIDHLVVKGFSDSEKKLFPGLEEKLMNSK